MRTEKEMYDLILGTAADDDRVAAVYMNGSRTNANAPKDIFQDYDVVYVVEETGSFRDDRQWIQKFGDILYMQYPDEFPGEPADKENFYGWLMQFKDGTRIDLHVETVAHVREHILDDSLCIVLMDKEGILPEVSAATDSNYWIERPTEELYLAVCNEFWWCSNNIAKGLWREEMTYAQDIGMHIRKQLEKMLSWKVGVLTDFSVSVGKSAKYMYRWLSEEEWKRYLSTFFSADTEEAWEAVFCMCGLFEETAYYVGAALGYSYNAEEGRAAFGFLKRVRELPKDAKGVE